MKFSENIALLREHNQLSQAKLAEILETSPQNMSLYEHGREPSYDLLIKIADTFHVSVDWLLGRDTSEDIIPVNFTSLREKKRLFKIEKLKKELAELEALYVPLVKKPV